jgi:hypothetical protein
MPNFSKSVTAIDWRQMLRTLTGLFILLTGLCGANSHAQDCDPWWKTDITGEITGPFGQQEINEISLPLPNLVFEQGEFTGPKVLGTYKGAIHYINCRGFFNQKVVWTYRFDQVLSLASPSANSLVNSTTANAKFFVGCVTGRCTDANGKTVKTSAWNTNGIQYDITWTFTGSDGVAANGSKCTQLTKASPQSSSNGKISTAKFWATINGCTSLTVAYNIVISQVAAFTPSNVNNIVIGSGAPVGQLNGFADLVPEDGFINYQDPGCVPYAAGFKKQCMGGSPLMFVRGSYNLVADKIPPPPPARDCKVVLSSRPRR